MSLSANSSICVRSGSILEGKFTPILWVMLSWFFACLVSFLLNAKQNFSLLGSVCFSFLINNIDHCSGTQLSYVETIWFFWLLLFRHLWWAQNKTQSRANFFIPLRQDLPDYSTECPVKFEFSSLAGENRLCPAVCECWALIWQILPNGSLPASGGFPTGANEHSPEDSRLTLCSCAQFAEISPHLCLVSLDFWLHLTQLRELTELCWVSLPCMPWKRSQGNYLGQLKGSLTWSFPISHDHCPSLPNGSFWKLLFYKTFFGVCCVISKCFACF